MVKHTFQTLDQMLQDIYRVFDHFSTLAAIGLTEWPELCEELFRFNNNNFWAITVTLNKFHSWFYSPHNWAGPFCCMVIYNLFQQHRGQIQQWRNLSNIHQRFSGFFIVDLKQIFVLWENFQIEDTIAKKS